MCPASAARKADSFQSYSATATVAPGGINPATLTTVHLQSALQVAAASLHRLAVCVTVWLARKHLTCQPLAHIFKHNCLWLQLMIKKKSRSVIKVSKNFNCVFIGAD